MTLELRRPLSLGTLAAPRKALLVVFGSLIVAADLLANAGVEAEALSFAIELVMGATFLRFALAERLTYRRRTTWRNHLIAVALALVVATAGVEGATRWLFRDVTTSADSGSFFSRRWVNEVWLNAHGFRERPFTLEKAPNTYRVAVVGDSLAFGNGLPVGQRFSDLMHAWLPDRFEVLNFSIPGDNTLQHLHTLRDRVLPAHPDFVLLQWFVNDIEGDDLSRRPRPATLAPERQLHRWLNRHSALYAIANLRWTELQIALEWSPSFAEYVTGRAGDPDSADARHEAALLRQIIDATRRGGAGIGLVLFPDTGMPLDTSYPFAFLHERVLGICREEGIRCLDLRRDFSRVKDRRTLWVSRLDHHPSARANQIAALRILEVFEPDWTR